MLYAAILLDYPDIHSHGKGRAFAVFAVPLQAAGYAAGFKNFLAGQGIDTHYVGWFQPNYFQRTTYGPGRTIRIRIYLYFPRRRNQCLGGSWGYGQSRSRRSDYDSSRCRGRTVNRGIGKTRCYGERSGNRAGYGNRRGHG